MGRQEVARGSMELNVFKTDKEKQKNNFVIRGFGKTGVRSECRNG